MTREAHRPPLMCLVQWIHTGVRPARSASHPPGCTPSSIAPPTSAWGRVRGCAGTAGCAWYAASRSTVSHPSAPQPGAPASWDQVSSSAAPGTRQVLGLCRMSGLPGLTLGRVPRDVVEPPADTGVPGASLSTPRSESWWESGVGVSAVLLDRGRCPSPQGRLVSQPVS